MSNKRFYIPRGEGTKSTIIEKLGEDADPIDQGSYLLVSLYEAQASGVPASEWILSSDFNPYSSPKPPSGPKQKPSVTRGHLRLVVDNNFDFDR